MNYKSSKLKAQSSRETPRARPQALLGQKPEQSWWEQPESFEPMMLHDGPSDGERHPWDLEERVTIFGEQIVRFSKTIPRDPSNNRLIDQLVGAGTSTGANYCEANEAVSSKDFKGISILLFLELPNRGKLHLLIKI